MSKFNLSSAFMIRESSLLALFSDVWVSYNMSRYRRNEGDGYELFRFFEL